MSTVQTVPDLEEMEIRTREYAREGFQSSIARLGFRHSALLDKNQINRANALAEEIALLLQKYQ